MAVTLVKKVLSTTHLKLPATQFLEDSAKHSIAYSNFVKKSEPIFKTMQALKEYTEKDMLDLKGMKSILRDKYVSIIEKGKVIFFVINQEGAICYASDYVNEILRYSPTELVGKKLVDLLEPTSRPEFTTTIDHLLLNRSEAIDFKDLGLYCVNCQRHYFDGMIACSEIFPEAHFVIYLSDVTERKVKEEKLTKINLELDSFIYKASHDLRAPLASLTGLINLTERTLTIESKEYIQLMKRCVERLDQYISKLAHYTRNSNFVLEYSKINFRPLLAAVIETYQFLPDADRIDFRLTIEDSTAVYTDLFRLQIILNNLISNAIKYQNPQEDHPSIEVSVVTERDVFHVSVRDNGIGIQEEYRDKIFHMFQRATSMAHGSGIGLYLVKKALDKINGKISVQSEYGKGTTFSLTIRNYADDCSKN